ncbi:flagellin [Candidatus Kryptonium thompsonii]|uniref:Flagellin n=1 Tax=Candidatus Kryptonium thompsonii TaxID=1633631 RepID=A0A0P1LFZ6_9BACT|nr:flagellin [Candidatus Kryptonium thompsoni]CUS78341.1 flagellin [Candidatus Kryptonium thompsoni]CUS80343.1 flagellin [Candidatus Kryptonium thompsoni]CUS83865.1 flagellin [Candidatus Kryptonium thompsoni]CUS85773.1 flagellin [Candidatus Kryptonium thompsoni]CUS88486.1 flagellin [Candidatus Kryptonium thompsoni]
MAFSQGTRINTNIAAMNAYNALNDINRELGVHQLRLATGKRINSVADDPSGYTIAKKLQARSRGLAQAINNVGDAKNVLSIAEGGLQKINDLLVSIKEQVTRAVNGGLSDDELQAIATQINDYLSEINDIVKQTKFNGMQLLRGAGGGAWVSGRDFQVGSDAGDTLSVKFDITVDRTLISSSTVATTDLTSSFITTVDNAIKTVTQQLQYVGSLINRLDVKETNLVVSMTNTEAAASRIFDADIAKEQVEAAKLMILQQTATAQLAQANASPQGVLALFR